MWISRLCSRAAFTVACSLTALSSISLPAAAQETFPSKPLNLIIPFGAGGITDVVGRLIGQRLGEELGQQVVILNRPGAGGAIAAQAAAQAAPDGYTLLLGTVGTQVVNPMVYSKLTYDPWTAFAPISLVSNSPYILAIADIPGVTDLKSLGSYAKANPGKLAFGSAGNASSPHLGLELFKLATQSNILHVPYKSGAEAVNAALSGQVQMVFDAIPVINPHVLTGRLKALGIADQQRNAALPDLRTSVEQGLPMFQMGSWNCLVAPAKTPKERLDVINAALTRVFARQDVVKRLAEMGIAPMPTGVDAYNAHVRAEKEKWAQVVKVAGTKID
jgi:tripartite-type tricarboxylate transporter receptor subunit TctC